MKFKKFKSVLALGLVCAGILTACGSEDEPSNANASSSEGVTKVKIAYPLGAKPLSYEDEAGNLTGYEIEVMKLVDEKLPQYEFEYVGTTNDDLLVGVAQKKYAAGVKNAFYTEDRLETYIFPKEFLGLSSAGLVLRKEHENIKTLSDFASAGLELAPIDASDARYTVVAEYNAANPNNKVNLLANDGSTVDNILWVNEGRVDGSFFIGMAFNAQLGEGGPYHHLKDEVVYNETAVIKTYPLFSLNEQELADAFDGAMKEILEEEKLDELMIKFYGTNLMDVLETVNR